MKELPASKPKMVKRHFRANIKSGGKCISLCFSVCLLVYNPAFLLTADFPSLPMPFSVEHVVFIHCHYPSTSFTQSQVFQPKELTSSKEFPS